MAFGDSGRAQNQIGYQSGLAQNHLDNLRNEQTGQNQHIWNLYHNAANQGQQQQNDLMSAYGNLAGMASGMFGPVGGFDSQFRGGLSSALGGYQNFADTGGFTPQNIQDIRARSVAPLRAVYANANRDIDRQRSLQGGYSPNYTAAKAKMAREMSHGLADASTNVEAGLAEQTRAGRLAGLGGMTQTSATGQGLQNAIDSLNLQGRSSALSGILGALGGATNVYGQAPGMAQMFGNQYQQGMDQRLQMQQLQNQLGLGTMNAQVAKGQIPGNFQQAVNIGTDIMGVLPGVGGMIQGGSGGGGLPFGNTYQSPIY